MAFNHSVLRLAKMIISTQGVTILPVRPPVFRPNGAAVDPCQRRTNDRHRRWRSPWRGWYGKAEWKAIRAAQLAAHPVCKMCMAEGVVTSATVVNHVRPHRGDWELFIAGPFESLCKACHDGPVRAMEMQGLR